MQCAVCSVQCAVCSVVQCAACNVSCVEQCTWAGISQTLDRLRRTDQWSLKSGHVTPHGLSAHLIDISLLLLTFLLDIIFDQLTQNVYQDGFVDGCNSAVDDWQL